MKTFEKWLNKSVYNYAVTKGSFVATYSVRGENGTVKVIIDYIKNGGKVVDDNGNVSTCKTVKEIISLVDFLAGGEC